VNLFIGEPNVGKSNILEAIGIQALQQTLDLSGLVRLNDLSNLFFENDPSNEIIVAADEMVTKISNTNATLKIGFDDPVKNNKRDFFAGFDQLNFQNQGASWDVGIHPYQFKVLENYPELVNGFLRSPHGSNLFFLLQTNKSLRNLVGEIIQDRGFKLTLRQKNHEIEISKEEDNVLIAYPFSIISDTLQRLIFYISAIESNTVGSTLIFEEPESNIFPYYTKYLAEKISNDTEKQYFSTTHNPYFLQSIIEKTTVNDLSIHLVRLHNYETRVHTLSSKGVEGILDLNSDVFLNFDKLLDA
jgi:AAA15 family ATPase/GTPase